EDVVENSSAVPSVSINPASNHRLWSSDPYMKSSVTRLKCDEAPANDDLRNQAARPPRTYMCHAPPPHDLEPTSKPSCSQHRITGSSRIVSEILPLPPSKRSAWVKLPLPSITPMTYGCIGSARSGSSKAGFVNTRALLRYLVPRA